MRAATALVWTLALACAPACAPPGATGLPRELSRMRHDRLPERLPAAWAAQLERAAALLPARALRDPDAIVRVRDCLLRLPWVDPQSVRVEPALPDGIRAVYRPRTPRLVAVRDGAPVALLASDGTVLPPGFDDALLARFLTAPLEEGLPPEPGQRVSDPLLQEALSAALEAIWLRDTLGVPLVRIQRRHDFPRSAPGVPPALSFVCEDGRDVCWGWSGTSESVVAPPPEARVALEVKAERMRRIVAAYPGLAGLSRVVVDRAVVRLSGPEGEELPLPPGL